MNKRAFFVIGPEGSGTYMLAEAFVSAGCTYCDKDDIEEYLYEKQPDNLVLRRSLPHAGEWPDIEAINQVLVEEYEYDIKLIFILRDGYATFRSVQRRTGKTPIDLGDALGTIAYHYKQNKSRIVIYEHIVSSAAFRKKFFVNQIGLKEPTMEFYDGNAKYYE